MIKELSKRIAGLVLYLFMVFYLERLHFWGQGTLQFQPFIFPLILLAALSTILIPAMQHASIYILLILWAGIYVITRTLYSQGQLPSTEINYQVAIIELLLLGGAILLGNGLVRKMADLDTMIGDFALAIYPNRTLELHTAEERIGLELTRSRRHGHPLTILVIVPEPVPEIKGETGASASVRRDLLERFTAARFGQIISEQARHTDLILRDQVGRFIILCVETDLVHSTTLAERIQRAFQERLNSHMEWGVATFPEEALNFEDLLRIAQTRIGQTASQIIQVSRTHSDTADPQQE